jgi:hypothetical protein
LDTERVPYLFINCDQHNGLKLNTTNFATPKEVFRTFDIEYIQIYLSNTGNIQIPSPAISDQLKDKLSFLSVSDYNITEIGKKAFDDLPKLKTLSLSHCRLNDSMITQRLFYI